MAKYLALVDGQTHEIAATTVSVGAGNAGDVVALDGSGRLSPSVMPTGIGADTQIGTASGVISVGDFVAFTASGVVRASAATSGQSADGFVKEGAANGEPVTVYFEGRNDVLTGLTVGARYYLSDAVPGGLTDTPVDGAGKIHQYLGKAVTTTSIAFEADDAILRA